MVYFSFNDFMDNRKNIHKDQVTGVEEEKFNYKYKSRGVVNIQNNEIPPIIKILKEKDELINFLNDFFKLNVLIGKYSIKYCKSIKTDTDINAKDTLTCKIENKEIFVIIKELIKNDSNIAYKMYEHSNEIIKQWNEKKSMQKIKNPIVIPVVIYTGKSKCRNLKDERHNQICYVTYEKNKINFSYNIIKVNEIDKSELENMNSEASRKMLEIQNYNLL